MKKNPSCPVLSSLFGFHKNLVSLCGYMPKKNKPVNLLSTVHYTKQCEGNAIKPLAKNKIGIDCMEQMVTHYSTKWPTK